MSLIQAKSVFQNGIFKINNDRDFVGMGCYPVNPHWPNKAKIAVSFVVNYEEGAESCILNGDRYSEYRLTELLGNVEQYENRRNINAESVYEYGSRCGFWRLLKVFKKYSIPVTAFACGLAIEKNSIVAQAMKDSEWEIASHGFKWLDYSNVDISVEREHIRLCRDIHRRLFREGPKGFYQGKPSVNTLGLLLEDGGFIYTNDSYADDLPYWSLSYGKIINKNEYLIMPMLVIPYSLDVNDGKFINNSGFSCGNDFYDYLTDTFDVLYEEGNEGYPKMMSIGLHCRICGRPGRIPTLCRFIEYIQKKKNVWICRRAEIAHHYYRFHYPKVKLCNFT